MTVLLSFELPGREGVCRNVLNPDSPSCAGKWQRFLFAHRYGGAVLLTLVFIAWSWAVRLALLIKAAEQVTWSPSLLAAGAWGLLFDVASAALWSLPLTFILLLLPRDLFTSRAGRVAAHMATITLIAVMLFSGAAEWFFWDEFGVRFNFIAVDYLVYTSEVIGNIRESYPVPAILAGVAGAAAWIHWRLCRAGLVQLWFDHSARPWRARLAPGAGALALALVIGLPPNEDWLPAFANNYHRELAKNGPWSFFAAFRANQLDYEQFYATMPTEAAFRRVKEVLTDDGARSLTDDPHDLLRLVRNDGPEQRLNVIQITVESLSADFLTRYGNTHGLTPNLDALLPRSLVFDQFYATGNRTDRGMEALTLSVPPTPGRSLVKRPHNENLFTLGSVFRQRGYATAFIYGGYGYFDNMNYFFGHNGYRVVDRRAFAADEVTFANVWGACDEDLFRRTIREADTDAAAGTPFFYFVMTTSNHRPYTFPDHRIDLPSKAAGRHGGVKYTDFAIGQFLREAATKPWFQQTVFVIVADHCASSAGRTELPVQNYHIPLLIYAPGGQVAPGVVDTLCSQVDFPPTLLGLLNWTYPSRLFGRDVLALPAGSPGRALIGNYQKLGLYRAGEIAVLKPRRETETFAYDASTDQWQTSAPEPALIDDTIAYYQSASYVFKHGLQHELAGEDAISRIDSGPPAPSLVARGSAVEP